MKATKGQSRPELGVAASVLYNWLGKGPKNVFSDPPAWNLSEKWSLLEEHLLPGSRNVSC